MTYGTLMCEAADQILTVTLNRPQQMNAFTVQMCDELEHVFRKRALEPDVGAVIVTGAGKAFCAGMDLSVEGNVFGLDEDADPTLSELRRDFDDPSMVRGVRDTGGRVSLAIFECPKPIIGAINGVAVGVGSTMTLGMDFRLASSNARFGFVFGRLGIMPEGCSTWFLPRLVGITKALEWCYRADIFPADEALSAGLVQAVHAPEMLLDEAHKLARSLIHSRSQPAIGLTRQMMWRNSAADHPVEAHLIESLAVLALSKADGKEGVAAFLQKRPADFQASLSSLPDDLRQWLEGCYSRVGR